MRARAWLATALIGGLLSSGCAVGPTPVIGPILPTLDATDTRREPGNWNAIHRVDVPDGWRLSQVQIDGDHELSSWRKVGNEADSLCGVSAWGVGADFLPEPTGGEPVTVGGRPGLFLGEPASYESLSGLWWHYINGAWASLECRGLSRDESIALAERVAFRPTQVLLPFRLKARPKPYAVSYLGWDRVDGPPSFNLSLGYLSDDEFPLPPQITMTPSPGDQPRNAGEELTINGRAALFSLATRTLCFSLPGWRACIEGGSDSDPPEPDGDARLRARLLLVADQLDFATDLDDPATWFDGNEAAGV